MLCTHHISNFMPFRTKMEEAIGLLFMWFLVAITKLIVCARRVILILGKVSYFQSASEKGSTSTFFCKVATLRGCMSIKLLLLGKCYPVGPFTYFLTVCVYQEKGPVQQNSMQELTMEADQW